MRYFGKFLMCLVMVFFLFGSGIVVRADVSGAATQSADELWGGMASGFGTSDPSANPGGASWWGTITLQESASSLNTGGRDETVGIGTSPVRDRLNWFQYLGSAIFGPQQVGDVVNITENKGNPAAIILFNIVRIALSFLGGITLLLGVFAAYLWMTAGGNEEKVTKAQKLLFNTVMGLVMIFSALLLSSYLAITVAGVNRIQVQGTSVSFCDRMSNTEDIAPIERTILGVMSLGATELMCQHWVQDPRVSGNN